MPKEKESEELKTIEGEVKDLRKDVDTRITDLGEQVRSYQQRASKLVSERPLLALGVAFAIGLALGIALSGSRD